METHTHLTGTEMLTTPVKALCLKQEISPAKTKYICNNPTYITTVILLNNYINKPAI